MTLLQELTRDILDPKVDITTVLRKSRLLAARLKSEEFEAWVQHELNGYPEGSDLPKYRTLSVHSRAHLIFSDWMQLPATAVMASQIPEPYRHWAETLKLYMAVTELASLVAGVNSDRHQGLMSPWRQEIAIKFGGSGYGRRGEKVQCIKAWREFGVAQVVGIIETVRNRLLDFVLKIEAEAPGAGEAEPGQMPLPQEKLTQIFNNHIYGGVAHIGGIESHGGSNTLHVGSISDSQIQQSGEKSTQIGTFSRESQVRSDLEKLVQTLSERMDEMNLDERARKKAEAQVATIQAQLADDDPDPVIIVQAGKTLRNVTEGVIGGLIATAIQPDVWQWVAHFMATHFPK